MLNRNVTPKRSQSLIAGLAAKRIAEGLLLCGESRSLIEVVQAEDGHLCATRLLCGESRSLIEV